MLIVNGRIFLENRTIENGYLEIEDTKISSVGSMKNVPTSIGKVIDVQGNNVIPGFIDQHIHGANGADHMDSTQEALKVITTFLPKEGTTSYLATTMTQSMEAIVSALECIDNYTKFDNKLGESEILGVHLEGPFISKKHVGAQNPEFVQEPTVEKFEKLLKASGQNIKLVTYAPEESPSGFTEYLQNKAIVPSAGHTDAGYYEIMKEVDFGLECLTHFHNAMKPHNHREPGAVTAGLVSDKLKTELITDGIHLDPAVVKMTVEAKGIDNVIVITDSLRAKGLPDGEYELGGQFFSKKGKVCRIENGTLAGSVAEMDYAVRKFKEFTDSSISNLIKVSSMNSAKLLNVFDRKGSIAVGKDADIIIVDDDIEVMATICRGTIAYERTNTKH